MATVAGLAARPVDARAAAVHALSTGAGNSAVARFLARQPAPPAADLSAADEERLKREMDRRNEIADIEQAQKALDSAPPDQWDFWTSALNDPTMRAFHFRAALILGAASPTTTAELDELLAVVDEQAADEAVTLSIVGQEHADHDPWAFPGTWARRVDAALRPPADLDLQATVAAESAALGKLAEIAGRIPSYVYANGLPVPFGQAMFLKDFSFRSAQATPDSTHIVRVYANQTVDVIAAKVQADLARGWQAGKRALVDDVEDGRRTIDPDSWAKASAPRVQPDLSSLVGTAVAEDVGILYELVADEAVDLWRYELALAKLAGFKRPFLDIPAYYLVMSTFSAAMQAADALVAGADGDERMRVADRWASANDYPAEARSVVLDALIDNLDEMAIDMAIDIGISAIPVVGWIWAAKEIVEEVADLYDAAATLLAAREKVQASSSVASLHRAAAELALSEAAAAAQVALTLISDLKVKAKAKADIDVHAPSAHGGAPAPHAAPPAPSSGGDPWAGPPAAPAPSPAPAPTPAPAPAPTPAPAPKPDPAAPGGKQPDAPAPAPDPGAPGAPGAPGGKKPDAPPPPDRDAVVDDLLKEAEAAGVDLVEKELRDLAKDDPQKFDLMAGKVREELAARREHFGGDKGAQVAGEWDEATSRGVPQTRRRPTGLTDATRKARVRRSHDTGTEGGRAQAAEDGITIDDWDNAESYEGDYGHGFDDVGRKGGDRFVLEYKGEKSPLPSTQMTDAWVGNVLARLKVLEDPIADELLKAAKQGKLKGKVYTTKVDDKGVMHTVVTKEIAFDGAAVKKAFAENLPRQRKKKGLPEKPPKKPRKPKPEPPKTDDDDE